MQGTSNMLYVWLIACIVTAPPVVNVKYGRQFDVNQQMYGLSHDPEHNHGGEGGLFDELVCNRDFESLGRLTEEKSKEAKPEDISPWFPIGGARASVIPGSPFSTNKHMLQLRSVANTTTEGIVNPGLFEGVPIRGGISYHVSVFAKSDEGSIDVRLSLQCPTTSPTDSIESGSVAHHVFTVRPSWKKFSFTLSTDDHQSCSDGFFAVIPLQASLLYFDIFSLRPSDAVGGLFRKDLFEALRSYGPSFVRIPGGDSFKAVSPQNRWDWKNTIGPFEKRVGYFSEANGRWVTNGFGLLEMLTLNELLETETVLSVYLGGDGSSKYNLFNDTRLQARDMMDLLEFCSGPEDSFWGEIRSQAGHPKPFKISAIILGSQEHDMSPTGYPLAHKLFTSELKKHYPNVKIISSGGVYGLESDKIRSSSCLPCVGGCTLNPQPCNYWYESVYEDQTTIASLHTMYDDYWTSCRTISGDSCPLVYLEFCTLNRDSDLTSGVAEALLLIGAERNADVVKGIAPVAIFNNVHRRNRYNSRHPLIYFNESAVAFSSSYHIQKLLKSTLGVFTVPVHLSGHVTSEQNYWSSSATVGEEDGKSVIFLKIVNYSPGSAEVTVRIAEEYGDFSVVRSVVLSHDDPDAVNTVAVPDMIGVKPHGTRLSLDKHELSTELGAYSLVVVVLSIDKELSDFTKIESPSQNQQRSTHSHLPPPLVSKRSFINVNNLLVFLFLSSVVMIGIRLKCFPNKVRRRKAR